MILTYRLLPMHRGKLADASSIPCMPVEPLDWIRFFTCIWGGDDRVKIDAFRVVNATVIDMTADRAIVAEIPVPGKRRMETPPKHHGPVDREPAEAVIDAIREAIADYEGVHQHGSN